MTEENTLVAAIELVREAHRDLIEAERIMSPELPELYADFKLPSASFAQILMNHLPLDHMATADKVFWLEVMDYMGPDYLAEFRRVGGFMNKLGEF